MSSEHLPSEGGQMDNDEKKKDHVPGAEFQHTKHWQNVTSKAEIWARGLPLETKVTPAEDDE